MTSSLFVSPSSVSVDAADAVEHLRRRGYGPLVDALAEQDVIAPTTGRVVTWRLARRLGLSVADAAKLLDDAKTVLAAEVA